jgi:CopG family transcriptional regulator/antitoxin EndoAI
MYHRINITLPNETLELLDRFSVKGDRSRFIHEAIQHYITQIQKEHLRQQLKEGAICRAERDRNLTQDWFALEEEAWQQNAK